MDKYLEKLNEKLEYDDNCNEEMDLLMNCSHTVAIALKPFLLQNETYSFITIGEIRQLYKENKLIKVGKSHVKPYLFLDIFDKLKKDIQDTTLKIYHSNNTPVNVILQLDKPIYLIVAPLCMDDNDLYYEGYKGMEVIELQPVKLKRLLKM